MKQRKNPPKRNENDARVSIQIPKDLLKKLQELARKDDRSLSSWMRRKLAEWAGQTPDITEKS